MPAEDANAHDFYKWYAAAAFAFVEQPQFRAGIRHIDALAKLMDASPQCWTLDRMRLRLWLEHRARLYAETEVATVRLQLARVQRLLRGPGTAWHMWVERLVARRTPAVITEADVRSALDASAADPRDTIIHEVPADRSDACHDLPGSHTGQHVHVQQPIGGPLVGIAHQTLRNRVAKRSAQARRPPAKNIGNPRRRAGPSSVQVAQSARRDLRGSARAGTLSGRSGRRRRASGRGATRWARAALIVLAILPESAPPAPVFAIVM